MPVCLTVQIVPHPDVTVPDEVGQTGEKLILKKINLQARDNYRR